MISLVEASASHIPVLAANMREADRIEIGAFGRTPAKALRSGLAASVWALTALVDDEPHAMMGVAPVSVLEGKGVPWMLGSEKIYDHARDLVRYGPGIIAEMAVGFECLENMVHVENIRAIRFLRHFGFSLSESRETIGGIEFVRFSNVLTDGSCSRTADDSIVAGDGGRPIAGGGLCQQGCHKSGHNRSI